MKLGLYNLSTRYLKSHEVSENAQKVIKKSWNLIIWLLKKSSSIFSIHRVIPSPASGISGGL